jgi:hypothetical protein
MEITTDDIGRHVARLLSDDMLRKPADNCILLLASADASNIRVIMQTNERFVVRVIREC